MTPEANTVEELDGRMWYFAELPIGSKFRFAHDRDEPAQIWIKVGRREYQIATPNVRRVGTVMAPVERARQVAPVLDPEAPTPARKLRETLREGEARQARADRGGEDPPYWAGYYHAIARLALEQLEEFEGGRL